MFLRPESGHWSTRSRGSEAFSTRQVGRSFVDWIESTTAPAVDKACGRISSVFLLEVHEYLKRRVSRDKSRHSVPVNVTHCKLKARDTIRGGITKDVTQSNHASKRGTGKSSDRKKAAVDGLYVHRKDKPRPLRIDPNF